MSMSSSHFSPTLKTSSRSRLSSLHPLSRLLDLATSPFHPLSPAEQQQQQQLPLTSSPHPHLSFLPAAAPPPSPSHQQPPSHLSFLPGSPAVALPSSSPTRYRSGSWRLRPSRSRRQPISPPSLISLLPDPAVSERRRPSPAIPFGERLPPCRVAVGVLSSNICYAAFHDEEWGVLVHEDKFAI